jgi:hypothetical protein
MPNRTRRLAMILFGMALISGCSDPARELIPAGSDAVVVADEPVPLDPGPDSGLPLALLEPGTRVRVQKDPEDRFRDGSLDAYRKVEVWVLDGESRRTSGAITRDSLRPIR